MHRLDCLTSVGRIAGAFMGLLSSVLTSPAMTEDEVATRLADLRKAIAVHDDLYYREARPVISDAAYDALRSELSELENLWAGHTDIPKGSPSAVGDDRTGRFPEASHRVPMLSLRKAYSDADLFRFLDRVRAMGHASERVVLEPKVDGMAISLVYENGRFSRAVSRGDGLTGEVLTENLLAVGGFPLVLNEPCPDFLEIRAEVYVPRDAFTVMNRERVERGKDPYSTPRNLAAGSLRLADPRAVAERGLRVTCHGWGAWEPVDSRPESQTGFRKILESWGFPTCGPVATADCESVVEAIKELASGLSGGFLPVDGIVVKVDFVGLREQMGTGHRYPHWAIAWKWQDDGAMTRIRSVRYTIGRTGRVTPVAQVDPVRIKGRTVSRVSIHTLHVLREWDLHLGDWVVVKLSGDVIPVLSRVLADRRPRDAEPVELIETCPSCQTPLKETDSGRHLFCPGMACPEKLARQIAHFAECTGLAGMGPATARRLVESGHLKGIGDLPALGEKREAIIPIIGHSASDQLINQIRRLPLVPLWRVICGLGIDGVGRSSAFRLSRHLRSLEDLTREFLTPEKLVGWGFSGDVAVAIHHYVSLHHEMLRGLFEAGIGHRVDDGEDGDSGLLEDVGQVFHPGPAADGQGIHIEEDQASIRE